MSTALVLAAEAPPWEALRKLVVDSVSSVHSRRAYGFALNESFGWYRASVRPPFSKAVVQEYRSHLEARLAAIRKLAAEAADNGLLAPELAAGIGKVKGAKQRGVRAVNWLEQPQARDLLRAPMGSSRRAIRDRAILGLLLGCALRRLLLEFVPAPGESRMAPEFVQEVEAVSAGLKAEGVEHDTLVEVRESAVPWNLPPELQLTLEVLKIAAPLIASFIAGWLQGRYGRKLRVKFNPFGKVEELELNGAVTPERFLQFFDDVQNKAEERHVRNSLIQSSERRGRL